MEQQLLRLIYYYYIVCSLLFLSYTQNIYLFIDLVSCVINLIKTEMHTSTLFLLYLYFYIQVDKQP